MQSHFALDLEFNQEEAQRIRGVTKFASSAALAKMPEAAKRLGVSYNLSGITSIKEFAVAINKICEAVNIQNAGNRIKLISTSSTARMRVSGAVNIHCGFEFIRYDDIEKCMNSR